MALKGKSRGHKLIHRLSHDIRGEVELTVMTKVCLPTILQLEHDPR